MALATCMLRAMQLGATKCGGQAPELVRIEHAQGYTSRASPETSVWKLLKEKLRADMSAAQHSVQERAACDGCGRSVAVQRSVGLTWPN